MTHEVVPGSVRLGDWERHLCTPVADRKIICSFEALAGMTSLVTSLRRWGAQRPLLIADGVGTGPLPLESDADAYVVETPLFDSLTEQVRARMAPEARLTRQVVSLVERYDPDARAAWWVSPVGLNTPMLGRPVLGGRPPAQAALEDKLLVDTVLRDAGVTSHRPSIIARASYQELMTASGEAMAAAGTDQVVWAGDSRDGINGGGDYVRWVRSPDLGRAAADFFAAHCDQVRVSPFLEGVPCSIHGIVLPDGVVTLRPVELATLRDPENGRFAYAGMGTSWEPSPDDAEQMRSVARLVGVHLQRGFGYRGAFGIDGVLTVEGFRVTELNPRFSGGLSRLARSAPGVHLDLVQLNALLGRDIGLPAAEIEARALGELEANRFVDVLGISTATSVDQTIQVAVRVGEAGLVPVTEPDASAAVVGTVFLGPSSMGSFARLVVGEDVVRRGDRAAPLGVLLLDFCDRTWGTGFGRLLMAPDVRARARG